MKTRIPKAAEPRLSAGEWILGIADAGKIEPVGRADRAAGRAIAGVEGGFDVLRRPSPGADPFERADEAAHLIVQERPGADVKAVFHFVLATMFFNPQLIQRPYRAVCLTDGRAEGGEIMPPDQAVRAGLHRVHIQLAFHMPR